MRERETILALLERNWPRGAAPDRVRWLYEDNPAGTALVWLLEDAESGEACGLSAAYPRRMRVAGSTVTALQLGDFTVDPEHRALGPGLALLRTTLAPVREGRFRFAYDHPLEVHHALYRRLGAESVGRMVRWTRPLDLSAAAERRFGRPAGRTLGAALTLGLRVHDAAALAWSRLTSHSIAPLTTGCGDEFDELEKRVRDLGPTLRGERSARTLQWKYLDHPRRRHTILCARKDHRLTGYAVLRHQEERRSLTLMELETGGERKLRRALVLAAAKLARERGADRILAQALQDSPAAEALHRLGFLQRDPETWLVPYLPSEPGAAFGRPEAWWMVEGDRDI